MRVLKVLSDYDYDHDYDHGYDHRLPSSSRQRRDYREARDYENKGIKLETAYIKNVRIQEKRIMERRER
jgi:hypothetical protein